MNPLSPTRKISRPSGDYIHSGRILKPSKNRNGYLSVTLYFECVRTQVEIQRLVAMTFIEGYAHGLQVDHINGDITDNRACNLRWLSRSLNQLNRHRCKAKSGVVGIYYRYGLKKPWIASVYVSGKYNHLGYFSNKANAIDYRNNFIEKLFNEAV